MADETRHSDTNPVESTPRAEFKKEANGHEWRSPAATAASRRARRPRRRTEVFPAQEGLQVLRREDRSINYKDVRLLSQFVAEAARLCRAAYRRLHAASAPPVRAIKQARNIALLPFAGRAA